MILTELDRQIIREIQKGIPLSKNPFRIIAHRLGIEEKDLLERLQKFHRSGIIRRFGARIRHHHAGYKGNIMAVWKIPDDKLHIIGPLIAHFPQVSHCYQRPELPDFPYNLYCMIHGKELKDCIKVIEEISRKTGVREYKMLATTEEYKKTNPLYFENP